MPEKRTCKKWRIRFNYGDVLKYGTSSKLSFPSQAFVAIGDFDGHIGLGVKCSKEVATAIRGAIILAKLSIVPVRRGYWGNKIGKPHTVPCKVRCTTVCFQLIPQLAYIAMALLYVICFSS